MGADVLREDEAAKVSDVIQVATALYATAAGREAFQHPNPDKGISIFGRALLDGLKGTPEIKLDPRQQRFARPPFGLERKAIQACLSCIKPHPYYAFLPFG